MGGFILMFETEDDTLTNTFKANYGSFFRLSYKAFHI